MDDLISRQAAIDALWYEREKLDAFMDECIENGYSALRAGTKTERNRIEEDIYILKQLPSAQPEHIAEVGKKASYSCGHENDQISRQAAIDAFLTELTKRERKNLLHTWSTVEVKYFITKMLEQIPSAQPEQRWIPCSERLPDEDGQYLITVKYKHVNDSYDDVYAEHGEWFDGKWDMFCFGHCGEVEDIIAWMPLPEPYRVERREE